MLTSRPARALLLLALILSPALAAQSPAPSDSPAYLLPPRPIVDVFDAPAPPQVAISPTRTMLLLTTRRGHPPIAELAQPMLRLAGARVNPKNYGPHNAPGIVGISLKRIADGRETKVTVPPQPNIGNVRFSPDGAHLSFTNLKENGIELWVADTTTGAARLVSGADKINETTGDPCDWLKDNATLVCKTVPAGRAPAPAEAIVPTGPNVHESSGKAAPAPTHEDMIRTAHDEALFEYYFTSQLASFDVATARKTAIGRSAILAEVTPSPSGEYFLVTKVKRPFSHLIPMSGFPEDVEIWSRATGETIKKVADVPSREGTPLTGVQAGPRAYHWRPDQPATIIWTEALDGGNPANKVPFRDRIVALAAPFGGAPAELAKTEWRAGGLQYTEKGVAFLTESDRASRRTRTWLLEQGAEPRKLWDRRQDSRYEDPGSPVSRRDAAAGGRGAGGGGGRGNAGGGTIMQNGDVVYLSGQGASPDGDRPFVDKLNLKTLQTERVFRSGSDYYESFVAPLNDDMKVIVTRYETPTEPPNYWIRDLANNTRKPITDFKDPQPEFRSVERQLVTYQRKDGVKLSATLYLPPGYKKGERLPVIMWAYPREFGDADSASEVIGSRGHFTTVTDASHLYLLLSGYAIFDNPTMPIVGPGETANDHYVEQLVASAEAAVDKVVEMGVGDRSRIGVGGHSYGGFMTGNLLAHSRLFRAGFAESAAYNRTLTPFGFQSERRTFWEVPDLYAKMSPFWYAHQVKDPILLMHGEADDNSGTFPIQSERFYMALKGHGATVRYVTLPYEAHGYRARDTLLHVLAERINWFDKYVKNAGPKATTDAPQR